MDAQQRIDAGTPSPLSPWLAELKALLWLGTPMALTQLLQFSNNTIDVLMIAPLGSEPLAASSLGTVFYYAAYMIGSALAMSVLPMVAHSLGADSDNHQDARRTVRMTLWAVALCFPFVLIFFLSVTDISLALGQPEVLARRAGPYVLTLAPGWLFMVGVVVLRNFLATIDRTRIPLITIAVSTCVNGLFNYLLIYGSWGFPRLELVGAGIATSLSHFIGFFLLVAYIQWDKRGRQFDIFTRLYKPDWERLRELIRLAAPIMVTMAFEGMMMNALVFLMGRISIDSVAAYQVTLNILALAFMIPLGMSTAGAARVGLAKGAGDHKGITRTSFVTIGVCLVQTILFILPLTLFPDWVAGLYLDSNAPGNASVIALVVSFLPLMALFVFFDAAQVAANQCLRGLKDVDVPMILAGISYWAIGFTAAVWLGLYTSLGAMGVWIGAILGLAAAALLLGTRLGILLRRH